MGTYAKCNTTEDAAISADTETEMLDYTIPTKKGGRIKFIRVSYGSVVDAKGATGFVELVLGNGSGPFQFPVGFGQGGATNASPTHAESIPVDIPVDGGENVKVNLTLAEAAVSGFAGIVWEAQD